MKGVNFFVFSSASLVLLFCLSASSLARTITFSVDSSVHGEITIQWTADEGVVGMGLTVDSDAAIEVVSIRESFFDVFVDSAFAAGSGYDVGFGIPTATQGAAGEQTLPATSFSISIAGLDDDGIGSGTEEAPTSGEITLSASSELSSLHIDLDTFRGGIVGYNGAMSVVGLPIDIELGPPCWYMAPCQPHGDYNGDGLITAIDVQGLLGAWAPNPYDQCADFNRDGYITAIDVQILLDSWGKGCP